MKQFGTKDRNFSLMRLLRGRKKDDFKSKLNNNYRPRTPDLNYSLIKSALKRNRPRKPYRTLSKSLTNQLNEQYKRKNAPVLDVNHIREEYNILVNDESIENPFIITSGLVKIIRKRVENCRSKQEKARAIFDWIQENIEYGTSKRRNGYKNSKEVINDHEGVCGEMAFLYTTMARCCDLRSAYVSVRVDNRGEKVHHACSIVDVGDSNPIEILVDPAYHTYDIHHRKFKVLSDAEILAKYNSWRR